MPAEFNRVLTPAGRTGIGRMDVGALDWQRLTNRLNVLRNDAAEVADPLGESFPLTEDWHSILFLLNQQGHALENQEVVKNQAQALFDDQRPLIL